MTELGDVRDELLDLLGESDTSVSPEPLIKGHLADDLAHLSLGRPFLGRGGAFSLGHLFSSWSKGR